MRRCVIGRRSCARRSGLSSDGTSLRSRPRRRSRGGKRSRSLDAEVVAAEAWLAGTWSGIAVHGQTDLILGLPGDRLLVVDYKRSKSDQAAHADAEGVRQPGEPVPRDDCERRTEGFKRCGAREAAQGGERHGRRVLPAERPGGALGLGVARCRGGAGLASGRG